MNTEPNSANPYSAPAVVAQAVPILKNGIDLTRYSTVRTGLQLIYYSVAAVAIAIILLVVFTIFGAGFAGPNNAAAEVPWLMVMPMFIFGIVVLGAVIAMFIGFCMCIACPMPDEKTRALLTVSAFILSFCVAFAGALVQSLHPAVGTMLSLVTQILSAISTVMFCLLLKRIGSNILSESLKRQSTRSLTWYALMMVTFLIGGVAIAATSAGGGAPNFGEVFVIAWAVALVVLSLGAFFQFLYMIRTGIVELKPPQ